MIYKRAHLYSVEDVMRDNPDIQLIKQFGEFDWDWAELLYYIPSKNQYLERGPYGHWDAKMFIVPRESIEENVVEAWIKNRRESFKNTTFKEIK